MLELVESGMLTMFELLAELSRLPDDAQDLLAYLLQQPPAESFRATAASLLIWMVAASPDPFEQPATN